VIVYVEFEIEFRQPRGFFSQFILLRKRLFELLPREPDLIGAVLQFSLRFRDFGIIDK
jgi:hypothetical protein